MYTLVTYTFYDKRKHRPIKDLKKDDGPIMILLSKRKISRSDKMSMNIKNLSTSPTLSSKIDINIITSRSDLIYLP